MKTPQRAGSSLLHGILPLLVGLTLLAAQAVAQTSSTGVIRGRVSNAATGSNLEHVLVSLAENNRVDSTERDGTFEITDLPPGRYTINVEYTGLDPETKTIDVRAGGVSQVEIALTSEIYQMSKFVVSGQREGNAAAIVQQKYAPNIQNVITSDAFGDITKANVGNFLKRMPGIVGVLSDVDTAGISLRGMAPELTSVDIDGTRAASAGNETRQQNMAALPTDIIEKVEVMKAPTPEEDADSLGGRIKLTTKSAFDRNERLATLRLAGSYNNTYGSRIHPDYSAVTPSLAANYSDIFSVLGREKNLGIYAAVSYDRFLDARSTTDFSFVNEELDDPELGEKDYSVYDNASVQLHSQLRRVQSIRADYKVGDHTTIRTSFGFNQYVDDFIRTRNAFTGGEVDAALSDPDPFYTVVVDAAYRGNKEWRKRKTSRTSAQFAGTSKLDFAELTYDLVWDRAEQDESRKQSNITSARKFTYAWNRRIEEGADRRWPRIDLLAGADPYTDRFTSVARTDLQGRRLNVSEEVIGSRLDAEKKFQFRLPVTIKTGARFRGEFFRKDADRLVLTARPSDLSAYIDETWNYGGAVDRYPVGAVPDPDKLLANVAFVGGANPATAWTFDPAFTSINTSSTIQNSLNADGKLDEKIYDSYVQGTMTVGKLTVLGGLRWERTSVTTSSAVRNRFAPTVLEQWSGRRRASSSYDDIFPSIHLRQDIGKHWTARASYSTTIGRPEISDLLDTSDFNLSSRSIAITNPGLVPQYSRNYDLSIERYFEGVGVVSLGAFQKDIRDYIAERNSIISAVEAADLGAPLTNPSATDPTWRLEQLVNNGTARVRGLEFNYSQQFSFLPGAWGGLGAFLNYTWLETEGQVSTISGTPVVAEIEGFVPRSGNIGLNYTYGRWDLYLLVNYVGDYLDGFEEENPMANSYFAKRYQVDFNGRYKLTPRMTFFVSLSNLTTEYQGSYNGYVAPERYRQTQALTFVSTAGITVKF